MPRTVNWFCVHFYRKLALFTLVLVLQIVFFVVVCIEVLVELIGTLLGQDRACFFWD